LLLGDGGVSVAILAAVFLSNLPEALSSTAGLYKSGWARQRISGLWALVTVASAFSSLAGFAFWMGLLLRRSPSCRPSWAALC